MTGSEALYCLRECPVGWLALLGTEKGLRRISLQPNPVDALAGLGNAAQSAVENPAAFADALAAFDAYFAGDMTALEGVKVELIDPSPFFAAAWQACRGIPPGETRSYQWLADAAGNPKASRAAATGHGQESAAAGDSLPSGGGQRRRSARLRGRRIGRKGASAGNGAAAATAVLVLGEVRHHFLAEEPH